LLINSFDVYSIENSTEISQLT